MNITAPITDYFPASDLIQDGDIISRVTGVTSRVASQAAGRLFMWNGVDTNFTTFQIRGLLNHYLKGTGGGSEPIYEALALRDTGIHIGNDSRAVGGDQVITGVGFETSVVIFMANDNTLANQNWSIGFDDGTTPFCMTRFNNGTEVTRDVSDSIMIQRDAGNLIRGEISAIGADGFTITWSLVGAAPAIYMYLCLP